MPDRIKENEQITVLLPFPVILYFAEASVSNRKDNQDDHEIQGVPY
jgi:hypothetical protein